MAEKPANDGLLSLEIPGNILEGDNSPTSTVFSESKSASCASSATLDSGRNTTDVAPFQKLSTAHLLLAHVGAAMALFLATIDANIISTSLPTIAKELHATEIQYTWVGVAYLLTQTAFQPLYGRMSDLIGRKTVLFSSLAIYALGSLLCGVAQNIIWLISARALAGIGGGGIVSSVWVITSEIVEVANRAKWSQALSITWSCSAIMGPLIGGVFSGQSHGAALNWRWGFYINLPITLMALIILLPALHGVNFPRPNVTWRIFSQRFDFGGLLLFMFGSGFIIVGFSSATLNGWGSPSTLCFIIFGLTILVCGGWYERITTRDCLFPDTTFKDATTVIVLLISFLHNFAYNVGVFYLALFYQAANGTTPLQAALRVLPYTLGTSLASMPTAWFIGLCQKRTLDTFGQNLVISAGLLISTIGFGLLMLLHEHAYMYVQIMFPLVAGAGLGMGIHAPYQIFVRALKPQEIASGTGAYFLVRFTGATVGLAVAGTVFSARMSAQLPSDISKHIGASFDYTPLQPAVRDQVSHAVSASIQTVWIVCVPCLGIASLLSFLIRRMPIHVTIKTDCADTEPQQIATKGSGP